MLTFCQTTTQQSGSRRLYREFAVRLENIAEQANTEAILMLQKAQTLISLHRCKRRRIDWNFNPSIQTHAFEQTHLNGSGNLG